MIKNLQYCRRNNKTNHLCFPYQNEDEQKISVLSRAIFFVTQQKAQRALRAAVYQFFNSKNDKNIVKYHSKKK